MVTKAYGRRIALAALVAVAAAGCSFSYSSESISGSIEGSSRSSSSSSPGDREAAYRDDVRDYTDAYVRSSEDADAFFRGLGRLAQRHGVSGWEADRATWVGIGEGLAKAGVTGAELDAFKHSLTGDHPAHMATIQEGFERYAET